MKRGKHMALLIQAPKGTHDVMPSEIRKWQYVEDTAIDLAEIYGFQEIRTPNFEHTELFVRSVGDATDVVQKEMYSFMDKGDRSITLRPEGTAGVARACLENGLFNDALPLKVCYNIPCYRYEKPQSGRFREFHQFGIEMYGSKDPTADAEVIDLVNSIFKNLKVSDIHLEINSIGCPECRPNYHKALKEYFNGQKDKLCGTCLERLEKNPMRILDCKCPTCNEIAKNAPVVTDFLCEECEEHFEKLQKYLTQMNIKFVVNSSIVRGLDYYTKTVFEFISDKIGSQGTVCGGGRYDGLVEELGGKPTPAIGFAMGIERLLNVMQACNSPFPEQSECELYIATMGDTAVLKAMELVRSLRDRAFFVQTDTMQRSIKAQMKYADKIHAKYTLVLGENEIENKSATIKNMATGETTEIKLDKMFTDKFDEIMMLDEIKQ
ncbi:MAG: histidine--tRNA ligase [Oscillospiraceae bacterium]